MPLPRLRRIGTGLAAAALGFLALAPAGAEDAVPGEVALGFRVERNVPPGATVETVCCGGYAFDGPLREQVTLGFGEAVTWLRIDLAAPAGLVQLTPILDDVTLFARAADGSWRTARTGDQIPLGERQLRSPFMALPIPHDIADATVYVRVVQPTALTIGVVQWALPSFLEMQAADQAFKTFLFGFICAMILFNSIVWVLVRNVAFLLNACSIVGMLLVALYLSGYGAVHVWASLPGWSNGFYVLSLAVTAAASGAFMWVFVRAPGEPAIRGWPVLGPGLSAALAGAAAPFLPFHVVNPWQLLSLAALLFGGTVFVALRALRGDARAAILLAPLGLAMLPGIALVALDKLLGIRPLAIGNNGLEITLCLEAVLFSLALTSRIRLTEKAAREASARLLALRSESAARAIEAQDAERRRLASELHDGVGHSFLLVLNGLKRLMRSGQRDEREAAAALAETTASALGELRRISRDMHPSAIEHLGLARALDGMVAHLVSDGMEVEKRIAFDEAALGREAKLHLYRIAQECVANTIRHADAARIRVSLVGRGEGLTLTIEDDGIGLHAPEAVAGGRQGLGFTSISERVRMLGGRWSADRSGLGGLAVRVDIPLGRDGAAARGIAG